MQWTSSKVCSNINHAEDLLLFFSDDEEKKPSNSRCQGSSKKPGHHNICTSMPVAWSQKQESPITSRFWNAPLICYTVKPVRSTTTGLISISTESGHWELSDFVLCNAAEEAPGQMEQHITYTPPDSHNVDTAGRTPCDREFCSRLVVMTGVRPTTQARDILCKLPQVPLVRFELHGLRGRPQTALFYLETEDAAVKFVEARGKSAEALAYEFGHEVVCVNDSEVSIFHAPSPSRPLGALEAGGIDGGYGRVVYWGVDIKLAPDVFCALEVLDAARHVVDAWTWSGHSDPGTGRGGGIWIEFDSVGEPFKLDEQMSRCVDIAHSTRPWAVPERLVHTYHSMFFVSRSDQAAIIRDKCCNKPLDLLSMYHDGWTRKSYHWGRAHGPSGRMRPIGEHELNRKGVAKTDAASLTWIQTVTEPIRNSVDV